MSVHRQGPNHYKVHWKQGGRQHSKTFRGKHAQNDANLYDAEIKRAKALGPHIMRELQRGADTLDEFINGPWADHAAGLRRKTRQKYAWVLENHMGRLLDEPLMMIDGATLARHQRHLLDRGLRPNTVREIIGQIGAILQVAAEQSRIPYNPVKSMRKVPRTPRAPVIAFEPAQLDALIAAAAGRDRAILVLGGWLGLRPVEIRSVPWARLRGDGFRIEKVDTKPSASPRTIAVPAAAAQALREWRLEAGRPADSELIVDLDAREMNYWNTRLRQLARGTVGPHHGRLTTYTLRHTHASMLHYAGYTPPRAAERMGHTLTEHVQTYAHVIAGVGDRRWADLDALIAAAHADRETLAGFPQPFLQSTGPPNPLQTAT